jgi:dTDP-glucose pyrophosphorylase
MSGKLNKAVVLARGLGKRMRRADAGTQLDPEQASVAETGLKAMIPVGRPFLDYVLSGLADAGYREVCLVIGPEHEVVRDYYAGQVLRRVSLTWAIQPEPLGTANALIAAQAFTGDDDFLVMNSDNYYPIAALVTLREMGEPGTVLFDAAALVRNSNIPAERVRAFAYAEVRNGYLASLAEKPDANKMVAADALVSMNLWRFSSDIFEHCRRVPRSPRGEYELPLAIDLAIQQGMRLLVERSYLGVLDLSQRNDVPAVTRMLAAVEVVL